MVQNLIEALEALGTSDASTSDGLVVCTDTTPGLIQATVEISGETTSRQLTILEKVMEDFIRDGKDVFFEIEPRDIGIRQPSAAIFVAPEASFVSALKTFLLYLSQDRILVRPIVCCKFDNEH